MKVRAGFTLVEMMVALAIFGLLAGAGSLMLSRVLDTRDAVHDQSARIGEMQRLRAMLRSDLGQAVGRRARGPTGRAAPQPVMGPVLPGDPLLVLVRAGWSNPDEDARSSLQRVEYRLVEDRLERRASPYVDGARPGPPQILMRGVRLAQVRFIQNGGEAPAYASSFDRPLPDAVRLTLDVDGWGEIDQLFLAASA